MKKILITVAIFLTIFQKDHAVSHHDHVHYELPEWGILKESAYHTSGDTSNKY